MARKYTMLYRFRNCKSLLEHKELQEEYFWFSNVSELNDPSEGFINFYWQGDSIAWLGLFKNYVWQLYEYVTTSPLFIDDVDKLNKLFFVYSWQFNNEDLQIRRIRENIEKIVTEDANIKDICDILEKKNQIVTICGLMNIFKMLNYEALHIINKVIEKEGFAKYIPWLKWSLENIFYTSKYKSLATILLSWLNDDQEKVENIMHNNLAYDELSTFGYNDFEFLNENDAKMKNYFKTIIIALNFSELYLPQMMKFAFMNSYTCSFAKHDDSSAMWGNYADNHKGIALIYSYENDVCDIELKKIPILKVETSESMGEKRKLIFSQVEYSDNIPRFNWFESLGKLFGDERKHWLIDGKKESVILEKMYSNEKKYLDVLIDVDKKRMLHKANCWNYEHEYRCFTPNCIIEFYGENEIGQKYRYDFTDLYGIIFGIRTSYEDKLEIINIVREKCKKYNRKDFYFYQAYFDYDSGKIKKRRLDIKLLQ